MPATKAHRHLNNGIVAVISSILFGSTTFSIVKQALKSASANLPPAVPPFLLPVNGTNVGIVMMLVLVD